MHIPTLQLTSKLNEKIQDIIKLNTNIMYGRIVKCSKPNIKIIEQTKIRHEKKINRKIKINIKD